MKLVYLDRVMPVVAIIRTIQNGIDSSSDVYGEWLPVEFDYDKKGIKATDVTNPFENGMFHVCLERDPGFDPDYPDCVEEDNVVHTEECPSELYEILPFVDEKLCEVYARLTCLLGNKVRIQFGMRMLDRYRTFKDLPVVTKEDPSLSVQPSTTSSSFAWDNLDFL